MGIIPLQAEAPRLLLCDIGNTSIKIGISSGYELQSSWSLPGGAAATADNLGLMILGLLGHAGYAPGAFKACMAVSVAPQFNAALAGASQRYLGCQTLFAQEDLQVPLANRYDRPHEVGGDRLVGAYAARKLVPEAASLLVVDYGTALTFDCIEENTYLGGLIFPGPGTAAQALATSTAKLPFVSLEDIEDGPRPCRDTATSIRHGLAYGYVCVTEGLCARLKAGLKKPAAVVATGGFAKTIARLAPIFDIVEPALVLSGLARLYLEKNPAQAGAT